MSTRDRLIDAATRLLDEGGPTAVTEGDAERVAALILAVAHGAVDLALSGHLSATGKGHASPEDLVDDLLGHLHHAR